MTVEYDDPGRTDMQHSAAVEDSPFAAPPVYARTSTRKTRRSGPSPWLIAVPVGLLAVGAIAATALLSPDEDDALMTTTSSTLAAATVPAPAAAPAASIVAAASEPAPVTRVERPSEAFRRAVTAPPRRVARAAPAPAAISADEAAADVSTTVTLPPPVLPEIPSEAAAPGSPVPPNRGPGVEPIP